MRSASFTKNHKILQRHIWKDRKINKKTQRETQIKFERTYSISIFFCAGSYKEIVKNQAEDEKDLYIS